MGVFDKTRTLPMPRPKVTLTFPRSPSPPARAAEGLEKDRLGKDSQPPKCASAGSGTVLAPMSVEAPNGAPQEVPTPSAYGATLALLRGRFPAVFGDARPLKIGIHLDIEAALAQEISKKALRKFLARWTRQEAYLQALAAGVRRIDLAGNDAGPALEHYPAAVNPQPAGERHWNA